MKCTQFQDLLFEYLDGTLSPRQKADMDAHVTTCASCRVAYETERTFAFQMHEALEKEADKVHVSPHVHFVRAKHECRELVEQRAERRVWLRTRLFPGLGILAACVIGGVILARITPMYTNTSSLPADVVVVATQSPQQVVHKKIEVPPQTPVAVPAAEPTVHGVVVGDNGKPVADAVVWAERPVNPYHRTQPFSMAMTADAVPGTVTNSDGNGLFAIPAGRLPEEYVVRAFVPDILPMRSAVLSNNPASSQMVRLAANGTGARIVGTFKDAQGRPVTRVSAFGSIAYGNEFRMPLTVDQDGSFLTCQLPAGSYRVAFMAPGYADGRIESSILPNQTEIADVVFESYVAITGIVRDAATKTGLADVHVKCLSVSNGMSEAICSATTSTDGTFWVHLSDEPLLLKFDRQNYVPVMREIHDNYPPQVILSRGGTVCVQVSAADGVPLAERWVMLADNANATYAAKFALKYAGTTDARGEVLFTNVPADTMEIAANVHDTNGMKMVRSAWFNVASEGVTTVQVALTDARLVVRSDTPIKVAAEGSACTYDLADFTVVSNQWIIDNIATGSYRVRIRDHAGAILNTNVLVDGRGDTVIDMPAVPVGSVIEGYVRDANGNPFPDEVMSVHAWESYEDTSGYPRWRQRPQPVSGSAVRSGKFRIEHLQPGRTYDVQCAWYETTNVVVKNVMPDSAPIVITMPPVYRVTGSVVDAAGTPLKAVVEMKSFQGDKSPHFSFHPVMPGTYIVRIKPDNHPWFEREVTVVEGNVDMGDIVAEDDGITLTGRVVDKSGTPVKEGWLAVYGPPHDTSDGSTYDDIHRGTVNADGSFVVAHVPSGKKLLLKLDIRDIDFSREQDLDLNRAIGPFTSDTDLGTIVMRLPPYVVATVRMADGTPAAGMYLSYWQLDAEGQTRFRMWGLKDTMEFLVHRDHSATTTSDMYRVEVPMTDAPTNHVTITLPAGF